MSIFNLMNWVYMLALLGLAILSVIKVKHQAGLYLALGLGAQVFAFVITNVLYWSGVARELPPEVTRLTAFVIRVGGLVFLGMAILEFSKLVRMGRAVEPEE